MARIRTIKPETPHSKTLGSVSRDARLLFVNLFTVADDAGRTRADSRLLASLLYPYDDGEEGRPTTKGKDVAAWLAELEAVGSVRRYRLDDIDYLDIPNWLEHQKIDRPSPSRLPEYAANTREGSRASDALPRTLDLVPSTNPPKSPKGEEHDSGFRDFLKAYPSRGKAANPKKRALKAWKKAISGGADPLELIRTAPTAAPAEKHGTEFVPQAATWLNEERWKDAVEQAASAAAASAPPEPPPDLAGWRLVAWKKLGHAIYASWVEPAKSVRVGDAIELRYATLFMRDHVRTHHADSLERLIKADDATVKTVTITDALETPAFIRRTA